MSHHLTIKIQTDPQNDAFNSANIGKELSRILIKYANSIKNVAEPVFVLIVGSIIIYSIFKND